MTEERLLREILAEMKKQPVLLTKISESLDSIDSNTGATL